MQPLVSIITPAYNAERHIKDTIQSVLGQTYKNFELIIVDDGSKDKTKKVVESFRDKNPQIRYIYQHNQGQSAARNTAIKAATGKYIAFLDADDIFLPNKLESQVNYLENHPDCDISYCKIHHFFDDRPDELFYFTMDHPSGYIFENLLHKNFINPLSVVLKKEILDKYGAFESSFRRVDEQYLWLKLSFNKAKFCYIDKVLAHYRIHKASLSNEAVYFKETQEKFLELLQAVRLWLGEEKAKKHHLERLVKRTKKRIIIGKLMAGRNIFSRALRTLYGAKRNMKFHKTT